jgi:Tfp pilus assembly protein PilF
MTEEKYREAIRSFEKTLALNPNYREVHLHLANCNEKIGNNVLRARHMALYNSKE